MASNIPSLPDLAPPPHGGFMYWLFFVEGGGGAVRRTGINIDIALLWRPKELNCCSNSLYQSVIWHMVHFLLVESVSQSVGQPVSQSKTEDWDWCSVPYMASKTMNSSTLADPQQLWCCRDLIIVFLSSVPQRAWRCIANLRMPQYKSVTHPKQTQTKWDKLKQFLFS